MALKHYLIGLGAVAVVGAAGCDERLEKRTDARRDTATPAGRTTNTDAINQISTARCEREQRCNNVGSGAKFKDAADCKTRMQADLADDLSSDECRGGIDSKELAECVAEIKEYDCKNPIDRLETAVACRESDLCKAMPRM
jgi:hypothetical protein